MYNPNQFAFYPYNQQQSQRNISIPLPIGGGATINFPSIGGGASPTQPSFPPIGGGAIPGGQFPPPPPPFPPGGPSDHHGGGGGQHQGPDQGPPTTPPPAYTPQLQQSGVQTFAVDSGSMRPCLHRFTYIWLNSGRGFWFYPTFVGRQSIAGYRWRGNRWMYYGTDTNRIRSFQCR